MTNYVVALGTFDGVHVGHHAMLKMAFDRAKTAGLPVRVATFDPHPRAVVAGGAPPLLQSVEEREAMLRESGVDDVVIIPFTHAFSQLSPREFVEQWIVQRLDAKHVVVGHNFRFGHRAEGDTSVLENLCAAHGITVSDCDLLANKDLPVSSSRIRRLLTGGEVVSANDLLGRSYGISGPVEHGARRGRELGMPTANIGVSASRLLPGDGVYGGVATLGGVEYVSAISVGTNPQFTADQSNPPRTLEVHLLDYDGPDFYGDNLQVDFGFRVRGQRTFDSISQLVDQMNDDVAVIRSH